MRIRHIIMTLLLALPGAVSFAQDNAGRLAVVEFPSIYMRLNPDYESPLETQELMGTIVEVTGSKGYWKKISAPQPYEAWCTDQGIVEMTPDEILTYSKAPKVMFTGLYGHLLETPKASSRPICDLVGGDVLRLVSKHGKWTCVMLPSGKTGYVESAQLKEHKGFTSIPQGSGDEDTVTEKQGEDILRTTMQVVGVPYLWGGMTPKGFDCSGLVRWVYLMNGFLLPRNASQQIFCGAAVEVPFDTKFWDEEERLASPQAESTSHETMYQKAQKAEYSDCFKAEMEKRISNLKRGDLLFFGRPASILRKQSIGHVGIYLGDGMMIHSSHVVRVNSLIPGSGNYYENSHKLIGAVRL